MWYRGGSCLTFHYVMLLAVTSMEDVQAAAISSSQLDEISFPNQQENLSKPFVKRHNPPDELTANEQAYISTPFLANNEVIDPVRRTFEARPKDALDKNDLTVGFNGKIDGYLQEKPILNGRFEDNNQLAIDPVRNAFEARPKDVLNNNDPTDAFGDLDSDQPQEKTVLERRYETTSDELTVYPAVYRSTRSEDRPMDVFVSPDQKNDPLNAFDRKYEDIPGEKSVLSRRFEASDELTNLAIYRRQPLRDLNGLDTLDSVQTSNNANNNKIGEDNNDEKVGKSGQPLRDVKGNEILNTVQSVNNAIDGERGNDDHKIGNENGTKVINSDGKSELRTQSTGLGESHSNLPLDAQSEVRIHPLLRRSDHPLLRRLENANEAHLDMFRRSGLALFRRDGVDEPPRLERRGGKGKKKKKKKGKGKGKKKKGKKGK
ncbi:hypothetical protein M8J77_003654 [Diaphorina citri]|nr:hypothetical protein M8J77_003654 [Diaphorina citri]